MSPFVFNTGSVVWHHTFNMGQGEAVGETVTLKWTIRDNHLTTNDMAYNFNIDSIMETGGRRWVGNRMFAV